MASRRLENVTRMLPKWPLEASWAALGAPRGPKRVGAKSACDILSHFWSPQGGSGDPLGNPWGSFGRSWGAAWRSRGCFLRSPGRSRRRSGRRLENDSVFGCFLSDLGAVFVDYSCLLGASPALFFCRVCVLCSGSFFHLPFVVVCCARKRRARIIHPKNQWNFMIVQSWSRRPRFEK